MATLCSLAVYTTSAATTETNAVRHIQLVRSTEHIQVHYPGESDEQSEKVAALIQQLGHRKYRKREEATRALKDIGTGGLKHMRQAATETSDPEIAIRLRQLVAELERIVEARKTGKLPPKPLSLKPVRVDVNFQGQTVQEVWDEVASMMRRRHPAVLDAKHLAGQCPAFLQALPSKRIHLKATNITLVELADRLGDTTGLTSRGWDGYFSMGLTPYLGWVPGDRYHLHAPRFRPSTQTSGIARIVLRDLEYSWGEMGYGRTRRTRPEFSIRVEAQLDPSLLNIKTRLDILEIRDDTGKDLILDKSCLLYKTPVAMSLSDVRGKMIHYFRNSWYPEQRNVRVRLLSPAPEATEIAVLRCRLVADVLPPGKLDFLPYRGETTTITSEDENWIGLLSREEKERFRFRIRRDPLESARKGGIRKSREMWGVAMALNTEGRCMCSLWKTEKNAKIWTRYRDRVDYGRPSGIAIIWPTTLGVINEEFRFEHIPLVGKSEGIAPSPLLQDRQVAPPAIPAGVQDHAFLRHLRTGTLVSGHFQDVTAEHLALSIQEHAFNVKRETSVHTHGIGNKTNSAPCEIHADNETFLQVYDRCLDLNIKKLDSKVDSNAKQLTRKKEWPVRYGAIDGANQSAYSGALRLDIQAWWSATAAVESKDKNTQVPEINGAEMTMVAEPGTEIMRFWLRVSELELLDGSVVDMSAAHKKLPQSGWGTDMRWQKLRFAGRSRYNKYGHAFVPIPLHLLHLEGIKRMKVQAVIYAGQSCTRKLPARNELVEESIPEHQIHLATRPVQSEKEGVWHEAEMSWRPLTLVAPGATPYRSRFRKVRISAQVTAHEQTQDNSKFVYRYRIHTGRDQKEASEATFEYLGSAVLHETEFEFKNLQLRTKVTHTR